MVKKREFYTKVFSRFGEYHDSATFLVGDSVRWVEYESDEGHCPRSTFYGHGGGASSAYIKSNVPLGKEVYAIMHWNSSGILASRTGDQSLYFTLKENIF